MIRKHILIVLASILFISACTKISTTDIGLSLIPPIDGVNTIDTLLDVFTNTSIDTTIARVYKTDDHVVGRLTDPVFGNTDASVYFELKPTYDKFSFPAANKDSLRADSAYLILSYKGTYGDTLLPVTLNVDEISTSTQLKYDSVYNSETASFNTVGSLGSATVSPNKLGDSVHTRFEDASSQIRIKLSNAVAQRFIKTYDSASAYANDSIFRTKFAGFKVSATAGNALLRINLLDSNTKLALYYTTRTTGAAQRDTGVSYFRFRTGTGIPAETSGDANVIKRNRAGSALAGSLNTGVNDPYVYMQTSPGTYATIKIPGLANFPNSLIHRAELIAEQDPDPLPLSKTMAPPRYLLLVAYDTANNRKLNIPNDYFIDPSTGTNNIATFGGYAITKTIAGVGDVATYNFNLSRYVQGIVTRKDRSYRLVLNAPSNDSISYTAPYPAPSSASPFYIRPTNSNNIAEGRVRLGGGTNTRVRMRLRIIYSKI